MVSTPSMPMLTLRKLSVRRWGGQLLGSLLATILWLYVFVEWLYGQSLGLCVRNCKMAVFLLFSVAITKT